MASARQLIGLIKSHAEGDASRFFDLAMQLAAAEDDKGHRHLAEELRRWASAGQETPAMPRANAPVALASPRGELSEVLSASYPRERLSQLVLPEATLTELQYFVHETRQRERLEEHGLAPRKRILLAGPPGTGKTMTASALAGELNYPLFSIQLHGLLTKFFGESAGKLRAVFNALKSTRGVYLFDEIDALAGDRALGNDVGEARRVLNSFLQFLDEDIGPSVIVATTNLPQLLDRAIFRRFDLTLEYELPDDNGVAETVRRRLLGFKVGAIRWPSVVQAGRGLSPADLVRATEDAARRAILNDQSAPTTDDLVAALERRRPRVEVKSKDAKVRSKPSPGAGKRNSRAIQAKGRGRRKTTD